jgi:outer membrane receptor protein involved in Fe transport
LRFNTNAVFNPADPTTYPERLTIRQGTYNQFIKNHTYEFFAQDKWRFGRNTLNVGVRYDLEIIPMENAGNPLFRGLNRTYPVETGTPSRCSTT